MLLISATDEWRTTHPGAVIGLLELSGLENTLSSPKLDERKRETEAYLRARYQGFSRQDFLSLPVMSAYEQYYKRFNKTYHVQLQVESIVLKGKSLPKVSPLVDSNFVAEVATLVLTAGHDAAKLRGSISIDVSREGDQLTQLNGATKAIRAGDMIMRDADGVCC
jgi:DNA/RNA-binding domain of Phe-tRNA-synthetase-like protein